MQTTELFSIRTKWTFRRSSFSIFNSNIIPVSFWYQIIMYGDHGSQCIEKSTLTKLWRFGNFVQSQVALIMLSIYHVLNLEILFPSNFYCWFILSRGPKTDLASSKSHNLHIFKMAAIQAWNILKISNLCGQMSYKHEWRFFLCFHTYRIHSHHNWVDKMQ